MYYQYILFCIQCVYKVSSAELSQAPYPLNAFGSAEASVPYQDLCVAREAAPAAALAAAGLLGVELLGVRPPSLLLLPERGLAPCRPLLLLPNNARKGAGAGLGVDTACPA